MKRPRTRAIVSVCAVIVALSGTGVVPAFGFGTINTAGQRTEHERMTRAVLACPPGVRSDGSCFEPRSMDQLSGKSGTFGAVGAPDFGLEIYKAEAHCDDADFLDVPGYPWTCDEATKQLQACVNHLQMRFRQGWQAAVRLLKPDGTIDRGDVDLRSDCTFSFGLSGRAKCDALEGFGRALHGIQDFHSHSNWADEAAPGPLTIDNPPGLNRLAPSSILDLRSTEAITVPRDLTTGFFKTTFLVPRDHCPARNGRITHACLNKDKALVDPVSGVTTDPQTPRGMVKTNAQKAVTAAIVETREQWADFRAVLVERNGLDRGNRMIRALTQDAPA